MWDAKFKAFQLLNELLDEFVPRERSLTKRQAEAVHRIAATLARELTNGEYEFVEGREQ